jgi:uncharacterized protein (TIGR03032 family)
MKKAEGEERWRRHHDEWRDPAQAAGLWREAERVDPALMRSKASADWWGLLEELGVTLIVSREYEHLLMAFCVRDGRPRVSYWPLPHPSGVAVREDTQTLTVASTRNPNQVFDFRPVCGRLPRAELGGRPDGERTLVPVRSRFYPGCLYLHDLAWVGGALCGAAAGMNAVVELQNDGSYQARWWPECVDAGGEPSQERNYLQLNSIAAGADLGLSFYTASGERKSARRPGHRNYPVDERGVLFSGATRQPVARGLTRPHSARLYGDDVWVDNSGYGELGLVRDGRFECVARLPGWTRGLCILERRTGRPIALVGTSRVIPRFRQYAPGLEVERSRCGVHAVDLTSGCTLASLEWPAGNQIFAVEKLPRRMSEGFPLTRPRSRSSEKAIRDLFYAYTMEF